MSTAKTKRVMSGMRPTGRLHIGHYFGALVNWLAFQEKYDCYFSIVDWHALTTKYQVSYEVKSNIWEVALDWLAVGLDPEKATIYVQSSVPEIAELHLLLSMITPQNWVERDPTLKDMVKMLTSDESEIHEQITYGLLGYPVLQAADILAPKAQLVPVGKDQEAHLEFARDVVRRFNYMYKVEYFPEPQPEFTNTPLLRGIDGQKMGKSYDNDIKLADTESDTIAKVKQMITDRTRISKSDPGHTDLCEVPWPMYLVFADRIKDQVKTECESAQIGCVDCKMRLAHIINDTLRPMRERRDKLAKDPAYVTKILDHGNSKARSIAKKTLLEVKEIMGFAHWSQAVPQSSSK